MPKHSHAWVVTVDMGYGHQRAAYPLRALSPDSRVLIANNYQGIPAKDKRIWNNSRQVYELVSRFKNIPWLGNMVFNAMDYFQRIPDFYPYRDLSKPTLQLITTYKWIRNKKWGKDLIDFMNRGNGERPIVSTFFIPAFMAEEHGYKGEIYCVICDADCSRAWAPLNPQKSRIKYFAPCQRVMERLQLYGVKKENIFLTGFPLPKENIGGKKLKILKKDLARRILNLDPCGHYRQKYGRTVSEFLRQNRDVRALPKTCAKSVPTITFAVGGAGAQRQIASDILFSLKDKISKGKINLNLVAGNRNDVCLYFKKLIQKAGLGKRLNKNLKIIFALNKEDYFALFNQALRATDVLWTKPSELVFYAALGLPIIMAPSVGSQEDFNRAWLKTIGAGISQNDPKLTHEWLFDWIQSGWLARAAMSGFLDERQFGAYSIEDVLFKGAKEPTKNYQLL
ncbi:MAG: hypothetical protein COU31_01180 [Candidatus Magasanikbacteria bacterium CG10_big_fil_rev_8_21_14_0_10_40_10]|uniref:DUF6938 domain-containing protein n=1 Tax=Candidatus Magasanikbacteria bacterium CG10_big_fil_rev_8_21_14_0_10_40_10 TaxID=1974648 RepID=A0A2M6W4Q1_9BACT|nr:MAG: hypothetical protein COU31_01180 [Candidatus Magasanikbacteria bacterium CG10_big_fil_rev_8_21_14_0_10_40_10]